MEGWWVLVVYFWSCWVNNVAKLQTTEARPVQLEAGQLGCPVPRGH